MNWELVIALPSEFYAVKFNKRSLPLWGYNLLAEYSEWYSSEEIALKVEEVEKTIEKNGVESESVFTNPKFISLVK